MHGNRSPRHRPMPTHFQILPCTQRPAFHIVKNRRLPALVVFLPTMGGKRCDVIKHKSVFLGIESRRIIRISRAPGGAIAVDEFAKGGIIRSLLLRARTDKSQQATRESKRDIQEPAPSFATSGDCIFRLQVYLRPVQDFFGAWFEECDGLLAIPYGQSRQFARGVSYPPSNPLPLLFFTDTSRHSPVI